MDPELTASIDAAIQTLAAATGAEIIPCSMPLDLEKYSNAWSTICAPEAAHAHRAAGTWPAKADEYGTNFRAFLEQGDALTAVEYADARILREQCVGELNALFADNHLDVLACPSCHSPALEDLRAHKPELVIQGDGGPVRLCIKNDGFCIKNDGFCIKNDGSGGGVAPHNSASAGSFEYELQYTCQYEIVISLRIAI